VNCFDCAAVGDNTAAVAVCADCGAAVCYTHACVSARWATRATALNRVVRVEPPSRIIRCSLCEQTHGAAPETCTVPNPRRSTR
jgi:hypothetical protein